MITSHPFGELPEGRGVTRYRLTGGPGAWADILDYGGTVQSLCLPDRDGNMVDVVLGYDDLPGYLRGTCFFGATVGRHANRIGGGTFTLGGRTWQVARNDGPNHLHGGPQGFDRRLFRAEIQGNALALTLASPHMDQGFPGNLQLTVTFSFSEDNALTIRYQAVTDMPTLVNLTNHSYFDLSGGRNPMGQFLQLGADQFCENDENTLPTGRILDVSGTPFDFRNEKPVGRDLDLPHVQLQNCHGYDHNFILGPGGSLREFAKLRSPETGIAMTALTDLPGVQLYSGNYITGPGKGGKTYQPRDGICLETQFFPNARNIPGAEKPILNPGEIFDHTTVYRFSTETDTSIMNR